MNENVNRPNHPFRLTRSETIVVTREKAAELAHAHNNLPRSPTERPFDDSRYTWLLGRAKDGLFLPCNWATVIYEGIKYRMNGQHSSRVILDAVEHLDATVAIHLDSFEADTREGMAVLFRQFDARASGRNPKDVAGAYQGLVKELEGINRDKAKLGIEGVSWYRRVIEGLPVPSGDDQYQQFLVDSFHPFLRWLDTVLSLKTPELKVTSVVGAMYATFIVNEREALEFWPRVAKQDLADDSDPRAVLSAELVEAKEAKKGNGNGSAPKKVTPAEYYCKCIKAWNAHRSGDKLRSLKVNTRKGLPDIAA